jgi:hypothetical protein
MVTFTVFFTRVVFSVLRLFIVRKKDEFSTHAIDSASRILSILPHQDVSCGVKIVFLLHPERSLF